MTEREALKLALEALEGLEALLLSMGLTHLNVYGDAEKAIIAIQEALAQPEHSPNCALLKIPSKDCDCQDQQEPVAITITGKLGNIYSFTGDYSLKKGDKVYTTPPQRTWVGLTDEEQQELYNAWMQKGDGWGSFYTLIEAKLKEKNT